MDTNVAFRGRIYDNLVETIGVTPLIRVKSLAKDAGCKADIVAKLEFFNPLGSVKDRIGFAMIEAAEKADVIFMIGYVLRFTHPFQILHETFAKGKLGRLVNCWTRRYMPYDTSDRWYGDQSKSGGVELDFASHDIDWLRWVGGEVRQVCGRVERVRPGIQADEHVHAVMLFDKGMGSVDASWAPGLSDSSIGILGTKGSMIVDRDGTIRQKIGEEEETVIRPRKGETIQKHFVRCATQKRTPKVTGYDGRAALEIVLAIEESSMAGHSVEVEHKSK